MPTIYTKTGDAGITSCLGGQRLSKAHQRIEACGSVDELNAQIGLCKTLLQDDASHHQSSLALVQNQLFTIGAMLASAEPPTAPSFLPLPPTAVDWLEASIDKMQETLPPLQQFVLPGGSLAAAQLHVARCACRRAERACVRLQQTIPQTFPTAVLPYLNRLSDWLFVLSRHQLAVVEQLPEVLWQPAKK